MTLVIDPKVALLKGVDPVQFCVFERRRGVIPVFSLSMTADSIPWSGTVPGPDGETMGRQRKNMA